MAKIKERKSESWKPSIHQDDGFISKNKKRKDKRMSLNLSAKKIDTDEFIPLKKSSLLPFNKAKKFEKENSKLTPSKFSSPALNKSNHSPAKKDNTPKFTPKGNKKNNSSISTPAPKKLSLGNVGKPNTPKNTGTPIKKNESLIKSSLKRKVEEYIDSEAEEGEEPVTDKGPKPYVKGEKKKKKSISFKLNNQKESDEESDDNSDESDDGDIEGDGDEVSDAEEYIDMEASEGEETDDDDSEEDGDDEGEDDDDDDDDDSENDFKDFMVNDGEALDDEDSSDDDDDDDDEDDNEDDESEEEEETPQTKNEKVQAKATTSAKQAKVLPEKKLQIEKQQPVVKKSKVEKNSQTVTKQDSESDVEDADDETPKAKSNFAGFAKYLPINTTEKEVKAQLQTVIKAVNIVSVVSKGNSKQKKISFLIYLSDEDSLEKLLNKTFTIRGTSFKIYKARENPKLVKDKIVAFLPRVPFSIKEDKLKAAVEAEIGSGKILEMKPKNISDKFQTRNILLTLPDEETLKKIIYKGSFSCNGVDVIVRQAFESSCKIPMFKVVFSGIPEKTNEAVLKKTLESSIGKGTVVNVKFSFHKQSFAFVTLENEEAQKKALQVGNEISLKGTKLKVLEFKPRVPKKRAIKKKNDVTETPDATKPKNRKFKNRKQNKKSDSPQKTNSPNNKKKQFQASNVDKKANLKTKIEEKKNNKIKQKKGKKQIKSAGD